jgi:hypothetical protein
MRSALLVVRSVIVLLCTSCAMFNPALRADCDQRVSAADTRTISVIAGRIDDPNFTMSPIQSAFAQWTDLKASCREVWSGRDTQVKNLDEARLRSKQDERCEYLSREDSEDEGADASRPDGESRSQATQRTAWDQLRTECSDRWQTKFDEAHAEALKRREQIALNLCHAAIDEAWSTRVGVNAAVREVDRAVDLWNHARAICPMIWSSSDEQSYQTAIVELQRRREASKAIEDARERERQRCGGGELTGFVMLMRVGNVDASKAIGCTLAIYLVRVVNNTGDGWVIVEPTAAIRSQPLPNGSVMQNKRVRFLGMRAFNMVDGTVNAIPTFALIGTGLD